MVNFGDNIVKIPNLAWKIDIFLNIKIFAKFLKIIYPDHLPSIIFQKIKYYSRNWFILTPGVSNLSFFSY